MLMTTAQGGSAIQVLGSVLSQRPASQPWYWRRMKVAIPGTV